MENAYHNQLIFEEAAPTILHSRFFTKGYCEYLLSIFNSLNSWKQFTDDKLYATHDINLDQEFPDLFKSIAGVFMSRVAPIVAKEFRTAVFDPYTIFALKYSQDTQTSLALHTDDSYITASIKLNNDYTGGVLEFPKQGFTNEHIGVGDIIVFPGSLSHPHRSTKLESGEKYSLTFWTPFPKIG